MNSPTIQLKRTAHLFHGEAYGTPALRKVQMLSLLFGKYSRQLS